MADSGHIKAPLLYRHEGMGALEALECMGCGEFMEIPSRAVMTAGRQPVRIRENPENLLAWIELQELDHEKCQKFKDADRQREARIYRRPLSPRGSGSERRGARPG